MLHLESKEYNLNMLLSFEMLKEVLIKLAKSQDKLEDEMQKMQKANSNRDKMIIKLEKSVFNKTEYSDKIQNDVNKNENEKGSEGNEDINEDNNHNEYESNENEKEIDEKEYDNNIKQNEINLKTNNDLDKNNEVDNANTQNDLHNNNNDKNNNDNNNENFSSNQNVTEKNIIEKKVVDKNINKNKDSNKTNNNTKHIKQLSPKHSGKDQSSSGTFVSPDLFGKLVKQVKEINSKLNILDNKLNSESKDVKNLQNQLKNHILDNESEIKLINDRINSLLQKNEEYEQKLENLQVKTSELDVFSMFKDSGDGTVDASKVMIKALEEKVFKKFELVDARYKKDSLDNLKIKTNMDNITPKLDQFHRELERINDINKQQKEDLDIYKKENEEKNLENLNNINNDINIKLSELKNELEKNLKNRILSLENQLKNLQNNNKNDNNNAFDLIKLGLGNNGLDSEVAQALEKKINDLRKKTNDLENTIKLNMNEQEIDSIKKEIKDLKLLLEKKITKDDLKELYNFHLSDVDEINDIKDREGITYEELRKTIKDLQNMQQRVESISGNLALLQNTPSNGNAKIIDFSKYIDNQKLTEALKPILREFEKIYKEIDSFRRDMNEIESLGKNYTKNSVNKLEEDLTNKINELKIYIQKKYVEKFDFNKTIKSIEVQIKSLGDGPKKDDAESWLLAKRPLKCFNCASCEANIKNDNYNTADYLPWKKYPRGEKIHRMGQGFSHMLQMMTSEFIKSIEKNEFPLEYDVSARNTNSNNISNQLNDKSTITGFVINNKEQMQDEGFQNMKKNSKMKLPKVKQYSKPKLKKYEETLPISDDEFIDINNNLDNNKDIITKNNSPKILKITKKTKQKNEDKGNNKNLYGNLMTMQGGFTARDKNYGFSRNNILKNEKNDFISSRNNSPKN